jgi:hypothetical protein
MKTNIIAATIVSIMVGVLVVAAGTADVFLVDAVSISLLVGMFICLWLYFFDFDNKIELCFWPFYKSKKY